MPFSVYFLSSSKPLTKTFSEDQVIDYPRVATFTSHEELVSSLSDLYNALQVHATEGRCLLITGALKHPLINTSRSGATDPDAPMSFFVLDLDGASLESPEEFLQQVPELKDVSYILHYSASYKYKPGLRCHLFFLLSEPKPLKFLQRALYGLHTRYGSFVDKTTHDNNRLLYIAPPIYEPPLQDPCPTRWKLVLKDKETLILSHFFPVITGRRLSGADFIKFNLNGGDSWGYYVHRDNPTWMYNFKGEERFHVPTLLPRLWEELKGDKPEECAQADPVQFFQKVGGRGYVILHKDRMYEYSNKQECINHLKVLRVFPSKNTIFPILEFIYDPDKPKFSFDPENCVFMYNQYKPSTISIASSSEAPMTYCPPTIRQLVEHVTGGLGESFLHWLAHIVQKKTRTNTAWILRGVQGTGKGLLFNHVLKPLFGEKNVCELVGTSLEDTFNGQLENKLLVFIDEVDYRLDRFSTAIEKLKHYITEPEIDIRKPFQAAYKVSNRLNFIFASNVTNLLYLTASDRRFHVGNYQHDPLAVDQAFIDAIEEELPSFYFYLLQMPVDMPVVAKPVMTEEKEMLIELNRSSTETVVLHLARGDLTWFLEQVAGDTSSFTPRELLKHKAYVKTLLAILQEHRIYLHRDKHLRPLLEYLVPNEFKHDMSPNNFTRLLHRYGLKLTTVRDGDIVSRGAKILWRWAEVGDLARVSQRLQLLVT